MTQAIIEKEGIGAGDEVFLTGSFAEHTGSQRNLPIIRAGNIASMPEEKLHVKGLGDIDAYLLEVRSMGGLSGSPVFAYWGTSRTTATIPRKLELIRKGLTFYWLGLMHGHFDKNKKEIDNLTDASFTTWQINMGIAIVIPVWKILEVINQKALVELREKETKRILGESPSVPDGISDNAKKETSPEKK